MWAYSLILCPTAVAIVTEDLVSLWIIILSKVSIDSLAVSYSSFMFATTTFYVIQRKESDITLSATFTFH